MIGSSSTTRMLSGFFSGCPGSGGGYWLNFGSGWCHLQNDEPAQMLSGATPRLFYDAAASQWKLVVEATLFVTNETVLVWTVVGDVTKILEEVDHRRLGSIWPAREQAGILRHPLQDAGVDMASPLPVNTALQYFERLVETLEELL